MNGALGIKALAFSPGKSSFFYITYARGVQLIVILFELYVQRTSPGLMRAYAVLFGVCRGDKALRSKLASACISFVLEFEGPKNAKVWLLHVIRAAHGADQPAFTKRSRCTNGGKVVWRQFGQSSERATGDYTMFTKAALGLAVIFITACGALAATKTHSHVPGQNVYNSADAYPGSTVDRHPRVSDCVRVAFPQCSGGN
jgi:hypothetical protein